MPKAKSPTRSAAPTPTNVSPLGATHRAASRNRAQRSAVYRDELRRLSPYEGVARIVIERRQALGLTQKELAERVGTSHSVISRIESGQHPTSVTTLGRLAQAFGTNLLIGFADEPAKASKTDLVTVPSVGSN